MTLPGGNTGLRLPAPRQAHSPPQHAGIYGKISNFVVISPPGFMLLDVTGKYKRSAGHSRAGARAPSGDKSKTDPARYRCNGRSMPPL